MNEKKKLFQELNKIAVDKKNEIDEQCKILATNAKDIQKV